MRRAHPRPLSLTEGSRQGPGRWFSYYQVYILLCLKKISIIFFKNFNFTSLFAYQRDYEEFEEGEYSGLVETDNDCTDYMSPLMSPTTQESQLTMSPVEDRVVSPCSELDLDTSGIQNNQ